MPTRSPGVTPMSIYTTDKSRQDLVKLRKITSITVLQKQDLRQKSKEKRDLESLHSESLATFEAVVILYHQRKKSTFFHLYLHRLSCHVTIKENTVSKVLFREPSTDNSAHCSLRLPLFPVDMNAMTNFDSGSFSTQYHTKLSVGYTVLKKKE
jgi:hypothetical protein